MSLFLALFCSYEVTDGNKILKRYIQSGMMLVDLVSAIPFGLFSQNDSVRLLTLLRLLRMARLLRKLDSFSGGNYMRVVQMMLGFVLLGHWFGLLWYYNFISELEDVTRAELQARMAAMNVSDAVAALGHPHDKKGLTATIGEEGEWWWIVSDIDPSIETVSIRWVCSLYWALSVMTNLKGLPAHESRECLRYKPDAPSPVFERVFTIVTFVVGAVCFSFIYGNIGQYIESMQASGQRYRKRMDEINEFVRFHGLPPSLQGKIRSYVEFAFSVTKGINVESISQQLPAHLQLEIHLHLNKKMVEQVKIFAGCPKDFFKALVMKLQPCICVAGDDVFKYGEKGDRMYFVKRGMAEVLNREGKGIHSFKEGDYFGEIALLSEQPRTADVRGVTDCMMLSLSLNDFEHVLKVFPQARHRIESTAQERFRALVKSDSAALRMRSRCGNNSPPGMSMRDRDIGPSKLSGGRHDSREFPAHRCSERDSNDSETDGQCRPYRFRRNSDDSSTGMMIHGARDGSSSPAAQRRSSSSDAPGYNRRRLSISNLTRGFFGNDDADVDRVPDRGPERESFRRRSFWSRQQRIHPDQGVLSDDRGTISPGYTRDERRTTSPGNARPSGSGSAGGSQHGGSSSDVSGYRMRRASAGPAVPMTSCRETSTRTSRCPSIGGGAQDLSDAAKVLSTEPSATAPAPSQAGSNRSCGGSSTTAVGSSESYDSESNASTPKYEAGHDGEPGGSGAHAAAPATNSTRLKPGSEEMNASASLINACRIERRSSRGCIDANGVLTRSPLAQARCDADRSSGPVDDDERMSNAAALQRQVSASGELDEFVEGPRILDRVVAEQQCRPPGSPKEIRRHSFSGRVPSFRARRSSNAKSALQDEGRSSPLVSGGGTSSPLIQHIENGSNTPPLARDPRVTQEPEEGRQRSDSFSAGGGRQRHGSFFLMTDPNDPEAIEKVKALSTAERLRRSSMSEAGSRASRRHTGETESEILGELIEQIGEGFERQVAALRQDLTVVFKLIETKLEEQSATAESKAEQRFQLLQERMDRLISKADESNAPNRSSGMFGMGQ